MKLFVPLGTQILLFQWSMKNIPLPIFFPNFEDKVEHHYIGGGMNLKYLIVLIGPAGCWSRSGWECDRPWIWVVGISIYRQLASQPPPYRSPHLFLVHLCVIGATLCVCTVRVRESRFNYRVWISFGKTLLRIRDFRKPQWFDPWGHTTFNQFSWEPFLLTDFLVIWTLIVNNLKSPSWNSYQKRV